MHGHLNAPFLGHLDRPLVAGVDMTQHTCGWIVGEDALEFRSSEIGAVGHRHLPGVDRPTDPDTPRRGGCSPTSLPSTC